MERNVVQRQQKVKKDLSARTTGIGLVAVSMALSAGFDQIWAMLLDRVREEIAKPGVTHESLCKRLGISKGTTTRWLNQSIRGADLKNFLRYMDVLNIRPSDIFQGLLPSEDDYGFIPKVSARLSAGGGSMETEGDIKGFYAFRKDFLREMGGNTNNLVLMEVAGDSMEPTILPVDTVLVATSENAKKSIRSGDVAAVRINDEIVVKRVAQEPGVFVLKSDNPGYQPIRVPLEEMGDQIEIIGKVRWLSRRI